MSSYVEDTLSKIFESFVQADSSALAREMIHINCDGGKVNLKVAVSMLKKLRY